jgi:hypothetical protein
LLLHQTVVVVAGGGCALDTFSCYDPPRPMDALSLRQRRLCVAKISQASVICAKRKYDEKEEKQPAHTCTPCGCAQFDDSAKSICGRETRLHHFINFRRRTKPFPWSHKNRKKTAEIFVIF